MKISKKKKKDRKKEKVINKTKHKIIKKVKRSKDTPLLVTCYGTLLIYGHHLHSNPISKKISNKQIYLKIINFNTTLFSFVKISNKIIFNTPKESSIQEEVSGNSDKNESDGVCTWWGMELLKKYKINK